MIFVQQKPEPINFDTDIRQRGLRALEAADLPPTKPFWKRHNYWAKAHDDLMSAYDKTCAYLAIRLFRIKRAKPTIHSSVEHFIPKEHSPQLAYEWNNYLLVSVSANSKRDRKEILDPRTIPNNLFGLRLNSGIIFVRPEGQTALEAQAEMTISNIDLKCEEFCKLRAVIYKRYKHNPQKLKEMSPFIYNEAVRQGKVSVA